MSFTITLLPDGRRYPAQEDMSLLDAALAADLPVPYGCRNGACGSCKCQVVKGSFDPGLMQDGVLTAEEIEQGHILMCCAHPASDMTLALRTALAASQFPAKKMPVRVEAMEPLAPDVMRLLLRLPGNESLSYQAGQYIEFILKDGQRRAYSIANAPQEQVGFLELHIRRTPGGAFSQHVFAQMKLRDILRIEGPFGTFHLHDADKPAILLAGGTGFAPIKAVVEDARQRGIARSMTLYWGAQQRSGLYLDALAASWANDRPNFRYVPVLSDPAPADAWSGRCGLVHEAVLADITDLSGYEVYACGAPAMIAAARQDFCARGLPSDAFFADAFTFAPRPVV